MKNNAKPFSTANKLLKKSEDKAAPMINIKKGVASKKKTMTDFADILFVEEYLKCKINDTIKEIPIINPAVLGLYSGKDAKATIKIFQIFSGDMNLLVLKKILLLM